MAELVRWVQGGVLNLDLVITSGKRIPVCWVNRKTRARVRSSKRCLMERV